VLIIGEFLESEMNRVCTNCIVQNTIFFHFLRRSEAHYCDVSGVCKSLSLSVCYASLRGFAVQKWMSGSRSCLRWRLGDHRHIALGVYSQFFLKPTSPTSSTNPGSNPNLNRNELTATRIRRGSRSPRAMKRGIKCGLRQITLVTCSRFSQYQLLNTGISRV